MSRARIELAYAYVVILAVFLALVVVFVILPIVGVAIWWLVSTAIVGLIIGCLCRLIVPCRNPLSFLTTFSFGFFGSLVGAGTAAHDEGGTAPTVRTDRRDGRVVEARHGHAGSATQPQAPHARPTG